MTFELPPEDTREALCFPHFPTRAQCFIFRNWGMVSPEVMASVLGCTAGEILEAADAMGLPVPPDTDPDWVTKGYITLIRANWHLLTYEQLALLLGRDTGWLAYVLKEDDFLSVKLGGKKPRTAPLRPEPLTPDGKRRTAQIRKTVLEARAALPERPARPFDFAPAFAVRCGAPADERDDRFEERIVYSYCALYGDTFADRGLIDASFPDSLLSACRSLGITGIWTQAVLYRLVPFPFDPELSEGHGARLDGMRYLVRKLRKYGLRLFLYLNEPRSMPESFFASPSRAGLKGHTRGKESCLCVSVPAVREYLRDGARTLCSEVPGLGGFITITASENLTNCYSHSTPGMCTCPRCAARSPAEVIADVNTALYEGARSADPGVRFIAWNWGWYGRQENMNGDVADLLPPGAALMSVSEEKVKKTVGGTETSVVDYSISVEGPGDYAKAVWRTARERGHAAYAKLQLGCTWEMAAVPCVPAFEKIYRHMSKITACADVRGLMLGWTLGGFPSPSLRLAQCFYGGRVPTFEEVCGQMFPTADARALAHAFSTLSSAFDEYPFHVGVAYFAPQHAGPSNLLCAEKTGRRATMVGYPYDDLEKWRSIYPEDVFTGQLKKLYTGWARGVAELREAARSAAGTDENLLRTLRWAEVCAIHFESVYDQCVFVRRRDREGVLDAGIISREEELARRLMTLAASDPTVGYESSNHYFYTVNSLLEKILNCRYLQQTGDRQGDK